MEYRSILLVHGERVPVKRGPGRPRANESRKTTVVHKTLANLTNVPEPLVALIERFCAKSRAGESVDHWLTADAPEVVVGPAFGPLAATLAIAKECGIETALGGGRSARLALFMVLARVLHQGSRRSAARWSATQAVDCVLGLGRFDEDALYSALDWVEANQGRIEQALAPAARPGSVFLYDVTSSYLEGQKNELAAAGYNRDGKRFKKQVVVGLLTDGDGNPVSVRVYEGNTADPSTVPDQIRTLAQDLSARDVVFVGDRGMVKSAGRAMLAEHGFRYVTSLTDPEVRRRLKEGTLQVELFTETVAEVIGDDGVRYLLRLNPATRERHRARRADQLARAKQKIDQRNARLVESPRADPAVSLKLAQRTLRAYKLDAFIGARLDGRNVIIEIDEEAKSRTEQLDGCYVVISDVPQSQASAQALWDRYGDLQRVERDFRTLKTGLLELRPIFLRKAGRTRAHALIAMLALKLTRELESRLRPIKMTVQHALDVLDSIRLVSLADPALGLWRLPSGWTEQQKEVLAVLPKLAAPMLSPHSGAEKPRSPRKPAANATIS